MLRRLPAILLLILGLLVVPPACATTAGIDHVLIISIDGLRSDALLVEPSRLPNLQRLRRGASTLNARTDHDFTVTLPNHLCMVTGRHTLGPEGHDWRVNDIIDGVDNLHEARGRVIASMFDVAHARGVHTGLFVTKEKLRVLQVSWGGDPGATDESARGPGAIDVSFGAPFAPDTELDGASAAVTDAVLAELAQARERRLLFLHYRHPDDIGHDFGWNLTADSPYMLSLGLVDRQIGRLLAQIDADPALRGRVAVIVTSDHGGGGPHLHHSRADLWINYVIPLLVWTGADGQDLDLYELNAASRADPGLERTARASALPPIRNGDVANLALDLLGLPPVPGSTINAGQDLRVRGPAATP